MKNQEILKSSPQSTKSGLWDAEASDILQEWDTKWASVSFKMANNPWTNGILPQKFLELISVALCAACTNLDSDGTRRHIRAALDAGASREEILFVIKCSSVLGLHSCSLGAPILLEEAKKANVNSVQRPSQATPACDKMKEVGQWNIAWDPFFELDPMWTEEVMATGIQIYSSGLLSPKEVELLSIALDASYTHMYAPGTRRHIASALKLGATTEEIMETLKVCVAHGMQTFNLAVPILSEELSLHAVKHS